MKNILRSFTGAFLVCVFCMTLQVRSQAQSAANPPAVSPQDFQVPSDQEIDLLRKDLRSKKKQLIAANMKLKSSGRSTTSTLRTWSKSMTPSTD